MSVDYCTYDSNCGGRGCINVYDYIALGSQCTLSDCVWIVPGTLRFEDFA